MRIRRSLPIALVLITASLLVAQAASARNAYVTNSQDGSVTVLDASTNQVIGTPIPIGENTIPYSLAISPDGKTVWVLNEAGTLVSIDTATNQLVGDPIAVPKGSHGLAITPDGTRAYLATESEDSVAVVDLRMRTTGPPIHVGEAPSGVAISPDGKHVYASNTSAETVTVIDTATNRAVDPPIIVGGTPAEGLAITPDGSTLVVANRDGYASVVDTAMNQGVVNVQVGKETFGVAINPNGSRAYLSNSTESTVSVLDIAARQVLGSAIPAAGNPGFLAVTPDGSRLLVSGRLPGGVVAIDTATNTAIGAPTPLAGEGGGGIAVVPDQSPAASFSLPRARVRPGVPLTLDASASSDPDGTVARFDWSFGDRKSLTSTAAVVKHKYAKPGNYMATLTVTDNEGCSVALVFTGQTASCHGSPGATLTQTIKVAYPGVKLRCPRHTKGACVFNLTAVAKKKKGRLQAQSKTARARVRPGKSAIVSLKPKAAFAKRIAAAKRVLVQELVTIDGRTTARLKRLKVVR
jgi:YVTN family beta-propeller protein